MPEHRIWRPIDDKMVAGAQQSQKPSVLATRFAQDTGNHPGIETTEKRRPNDAAPSDPPGRSVPDHCWAVTGVRMRRRFAGSFRFPHIESTSNPPQITRDNKFFW